VVRHVQSVCCTLKLTNYKTFLVPGWFTAPCSKRYTAYHVFFQWKSLAKWEGFSPVKVPWKTLYSRLLSQENSVLHCTCYCKWHNSLCCLAIERELVSSVDYSDVVCDFALKRVREAKLDSYKTSIKETVAFFPKLLYFMNYIFTIFKILIFANY
jgi:hypothetical protein